MSSSNPTEQDAVDCGSLEGFLQTDCMKSRVADRKSTFTWSDEQVREGLWKTEKALADLELREYDHTKQLATTSAIPKAKFDLFKSQMQSAMTLIHQIQDEMGLRHSEMYGKLSTDIVDTKGKLQSYVQNGVIDVDGKVQLLRRRELALTAQLLALIETQRKTLNSKIEGFHDQEESGIKGVRNFTESVQREMQESDERLMDAINAASGNLDSLAARESSHYAGLSSGITEQDAQEDRDREDVTNFLLNRTTSVRDSLLGMLSRGRSAVLGRLEGGRSGGQTLLERQRAALASRAARLGAELGRQRAAQAEDDSD
eukprot:CAMPEP_0113666134 /NCGR_PEP_ID=MMETSP0038_2-20120614/2697_1 /TAXON_ID=2898 /ORGANISM="Cryptomonas paramecium" /LENGTH=314 /DNA_ID=CAMNT_0000581575 /DNA_START=222 /DNA_END=1163 /DNA_ORIENTATION=+ /assembly_acc=CAM_ASM_000170